MELLASLTILTPPTVLIHLSIILLTLQILAILMIHLDLCFTRELRTQHATKSIVPIKLYRTAFISVVLATACPGDRSSRRSGVRIHLSHNGDNHILVNTGC